MKNSGISVLIFGLLTLMFTSCEKYLDKFPNGTLSTDSYYKTENDAVGAINSAYSPLQNFFLKSLSFEKDIISDDAVKGQGVDLGDFTNFDNLNLNAGDGPVSTLWGLYYQGIYRCNLVLDNVPEISMNEALKNRVLGEAHFLRGFYYYNLAIRFGGLPIVKTTINTEKKPARSTIEDTWAFIEEDLKQAANLLPSKREYDDSNIGRADKGAALSLIGNVNLYQQKWQDAFDNYKSVIESGDYTLLGDFGNLFKPEFNNASESVFETQFKGGSLLDYGNGFNFWVRPRNGSTIFGLGFDMPTQSLVNEFEPNDPRLKYTVFQQGDIISDEVKDYPFQAQWAPETGMNCAKYVKDIPVGSNAEKMGQNLKQIRYAEVLLGYAEAAYRLGNNSEAVAKINMVRARARGASSDILPDVKITDDIFNAIVHERRVELALEGKRYFDLVRWGLAEQKLAAKGYKPERKGLYPIPQGERDVNPNLTQNPGY